MSDGDGRPGRTPATTHVAGEDAGQQGDTHPTAGGPRGWYSRGYLPHFDGGDIVQMVTFRLADSFPRRLLATWADELARLPQQAIEAEQRRRMEAHLDTGMGAAWLRDARIAQIVQDSLLYFDGRRYHLYAWVVMPTHVHVLMAPLHPHSLSNIVAAWKSYTATQANQALGRQGAFWHRDYFDRYIRDERHFAAAVNYIAANPVRAGLCATSDQWLFGSAGFLSAAEGEGPRPNGPATPGTEGTHPGILPAQASRHSRR